MSEGFAILSRLPHRTRRARLIPLFAATALLSVSTAVHSQTPAGPNPEVASDPSFEVLPDAPTPQSAGPAQSAVPAPPNDKDAVTLRTVPVNILKDEEAIWTSPIRIRERNFPILIPLVLATALTITIDHQAMTSAKLQNPSLNSHANTASNGLLGGFIVAPVAIYGIGYLHHNSHATETGILAGEAMVHSLIVGEVLKAVTMRERPNVDNARGQFFQSSVGFNSSFPSAHSTLAWSSATVIASEYPGLLTQITAYGLASGVSLTRVLAKQHFPSDVLVGSAVGWLVGRYIVHKHHRITADY